MGRPTKLRFTNVENVAAGGMGTLRLPIGLWLYRNVKLIHLRSGVRATEAQMKSDIDQIRVLANGKVQRKFTVDELFELVNKFNGRAVRAGELPIYFAEPWARIAGQEDLLKWGTLGLDSFTIEIDFNPAAVAPTMRATASVDPVGVPLAGISKIYRETREVTGAGIKSILDLPRLDLIRRVHFDSSVISKVEVYRNNVKIYDRTRDEMEDDLADRGFVTSTNVFHVVFDDDERIDSVVNTQENGRAVNELRFDLTVTGAAVIPITIERIGNPD